MVVINKSPEVQPLDIRRFEEMIDGERHGTDVITGRRLPLDESFAVPSRTAVILELR
jgi:hypothetical protein